VLASLVQVLEVQHSTQALTLEVSLATTETMTMQAAAEEALEVQVATGDLLTANLVPAEVTAEQRLHIMALQSVAVVADLTHL
jgi:hypothetical protein